MNKFEEGIEAIVHATFGDGRGRWLKEARVADCEPWVLPRSSDEMLANPTDLDIERLGWFQLVVDGNGGTLGVDGTRVPPAIGRVDVSFVTERSAVRIAADSSGNKRNLMSPMSIAVWDESGFSRQSAGWDGRQWRALSEAAADMVGVAMCIHVARADVWRVVVTPEAGVPVSFSTDARGVAESFKLREAPSPMKRRTALLHWVAEHWRKRRDDPSALTHVREHLRGATEFVWNDWKCKIRPSRVDLAALGDLGRRFT